MFQLKDGPEGIAGRGLSAALHGVGNFQPFGKKETKLNAKQTIASALYLANKTPRGLEDIHAMAS